MKTGTAVLIGVGSLIVVGGIITAIVLSKKSSSSQTPPTVPAGTSIVNNPTEEQKSKLSGWEKAQLALGLISVGIDQYGKVVGIKNEQA